MAPSSAMDRAPIMLSSPATTQTTRIQPADGSNCAIVCGVRKTPEPMTVPTPRKKASQNPNLRGSELAVPIASWEAAIITRHNTEYGIQNTEERQSQPE